MLPAAGIDVSQPLKWGAQKNLILSHQRRSARTTGRCGGLDRTRCPTATLISEKQLPTGGMMKPKPKQSDRAPSQQSAQNHLPGPLAAILPFSTDQHYTPHAELGHFIALFTLSCLSCLPSSLPSGAISPQHHLSGLIKVLLIQLRARIRSFWEDQMDQDQDPVKLTLVRHHY